MAPLTYIKASPPSTITEVEHETVFVTDYLPTTVMQGGTVTSIQTVALIRPTTETVPVGDRVTTVTITAPITQIMVTGSCAGSTNQDGLDRQIKEKQRHDKICQQSRQELLVKLTGNCTYGGIRIQDLNASLKTQTLANTGGTSGGSSGSECNFDDLTSAQKEADPAKQQGQLNAIYVSFCSKQASSSSSLSSTATLGNGSNLGAFGLYTASRSATATQNSGASYDYSTSANSTATTSVVY